MREDIKAIPIMEAAGWKTIPGKTIGDCSSFSKDNKRVWRAVKDSNTIGWRYAELIDGHYTNHKWTTIEEICKE